MQSDVAHAKETVLRYLMGGKVATAELDSAYELLRQVSPNSLGRLKEGLKPAPEAPEDCLICRENMAELASMTAQERHTQARELVHHLRACDDCRARFRMTRQVWTDIAESAVGAARELTDALRIAVDRGRQLLRLDEESALAFGTLQPTAGVALAEPGTGTVREEWSVVDDGTGFSVQFAAFPNPGAGSVILQCDLVDPDGEPLPHADVTIEIVSRRSGSALVSASLDDFDDEPLELPPGDWSLRVRTEEDTGETREWRIRVDVRGPDGSFNADETERLT